MAKMIDLGHMEPMHDAPVEARRTPRKEYPTVWVRHTDLPLVPTDVGKTLTAQVTIHVTGIEEQTNERRGKRKEYRFELRSMAIHNERNRLKNAIRKNAR